MKTMTTAAAVLVAALLGGCKTPQVALDQANHGVSMIAGLEQALGELRRVETHALKARTESIRLKRDAVARIDRAAKFDARTRVEVGDTASGAALERLLASTDAVAAEDSAYLAAIARNEADIAALLTPLPTTRAATSVAQDALADLGKQLDGTVRRDELLDFARGVVVSVNEAKGRIAAAQAAASASALAQAAPASTQPGE